MNGNSDKLRLLGAMGIFGSVGIFVRHIPLSSAAVACARGAMGCLFLLAFLLLTGKKMSFDKIRSKLLLVCLSGAAVGGNWVLLFEAYRHTTVATATVCYYLAPLLLLLASPLLGEKLTGRKLLSLGVALVGMVLISGMADGRLPQLADLTGIAFGIAAAVLYAAVMLLNKKMGDIPAYDKTLWQLGAGTLVVLPYLLLTEGFRTDGMTPVAWVLLSVVGIVHTGAAYVLYFGSLGKLNARTVAVFSYLDPVVAVALSALILREPMGMTDVVGAVLILGSALCSELPARNKQTA